MNTVNYLVVQTTEEQEYLQICGIGYEPRRFETPSGTYTVISVEPLNEDAILDTVEQLVGPVGEVWDEGNDVVTYLDHSEMLEVLAQYAVPEDEEDV